MGNMRLPQKAGGTPEEIDYEKSQEIIDYAMANGINYYDTAYVYQNGASETFLGHAMKKYKREDFYLATKFNIQANPDYKGVFQTQLDRLQTDYIDFYLIHCLLDNNIDDYISSGAIEYFLEQKKLGKIKYLGFSSHASLETLEKFADHHHWDFAQLQINYFDWNYGNTKAEYKILDDRKIPCIVMEPVRGGRLASLTPEADSLLKAAHPDWSIASWALRFVKSLPNVVVTLSGMSNMEQIIDNVATFSSKEEFSKNDEEVLFKACDMFRSQVRVPCTECRYCTPECPMNISIPEFLKVYNAYKVDGPNALGRLKDIESDGKPADCIGCGACTKHCPQSIPIPDLMKELAEVSK